MAHKSQFTGAKIDEALAKILNIEITENGCIRLPSTESSPINLDTQTSPGFYELDYYTSSRSIPFTEQPITLTVIQFTDPDTGNTKYSQIVSFIGKSYSRDVDRTDPVAPVYTEWEINAGERQMIISTSDPAVNSVALYTPYINITNAAAPVLKILIEDVSGATPVRKWIDMIPSSLLSKAVYDPKNHATDIFKYVDDAIAAADIGTITEDFTTHINDATIHATQAERDSWNAKVSQENLASTLQTILEYVETQVTTAASTLQGDATDIATKLVGLNANLDTHAADTTVHPSAEKMAEWDSKANGDHTHLSDNRVEIDASKVVSGTMDLARISDKMLMKIVTVDDEVARKALTVSDVQNGDSVYQQRSQYTSNVIRPLSTMYGIAYGNGLYVAIVNGHGSTLTSSDGFIWNIQSNDIPDVYDLNAIIYANNQFIMVGYNGAILTSPDGITWTKQTSGVTGELRSITYSNNQYVAVGDLGTILTSTDGINWIKRTSPVGNSLFSITYGNKLYVAAGSSGNGTILTSPDGITWTREVHNSTYDIYSIVYANNQYTTVGVNGTILTSPDGATWTKRTSGTTAWLRSITYGNNLYVAVGSSGTILTSSDGISWTKQLFPIENTDLYNIKYSNNQFIAIGNTVILTSLDGIAWTVNFDPVNTTIYSITHGDNLYVAIQYTGTILTSPDGFNWTRHTNTGAIQSTNYNIEYLNNLYIVIGDAGTILTSPDGFNWTKRSNGYSEYLAAIAYGDNKFVLATSTGAFYTSSDTITWTRQAFTTRNNSRIETIKYINNQFIGVGTDDIITSLNGVDWVEKLHGSLIGLEDIAYGNNLYVACGQHGRILTSQNTDTWATRASGVTLETLYAITYNNGLFMIGGTTGAILTSLDGIIWTKRRNPDPNNYGTDDMVYHNGICIGVGFAGTIQSFSYPEANSFYYVVDDTKLSSDDGWLMYSSTQVMELVWEKITGRPSTLSGYGITDAYNKSEVDTSIKTALTDPLAALQTKLDDITTKVNKLATYTNSADIKLLTTQLSSLAEDFDEVKAQHAQILTSVQSIDKSIVNLKALI